MLGEKKVPLHGSLQVQEGHVERAIEGMVMHLQRPATQLLSTVTKETRIWRTKRCPRRTGCERQGNEEDAKPLGIEKGGPGVLKCLDQNAVDHILTASVVPRFSLCKALHVGLDHASPTFQEGFPTSTS